MRLRSWWSLWYSSWFADAVVGQVRSRATTGGVPRRGQCGGTQRRWDFVVRVSGWPGLRRITVELVSQGKRYPLFTEEQRRWGSSAAGSRSDRCTSLRPERTRSDRGTGPARGVCRHVCLAPDPTTVGSRCGAGRSRSI